LRFMRVNHKVVSRKLQVTGKRILITGNEAIGEAAIKAGCHFYAGYPITPQNELTAYMARRMREVGRVFIQAESELAAINMVFGASACGFRAMTSSSSPGISLKQEGISYLAGCQLPAVLVNIMRGGPGLGNIAPSQSDYFQAIKGGGHGDYRLIVLAPSSVEEAFNLTMLAFDLADRYRNPAMILADAFLGQMAEPIEIQNSKFKIQNYKKIWALTGAKNREPNIIRSLFLKEGVLEEHNKRLQQKYKLIEEKETRFQELNLKKAQILFVAYGCAFRVASGAADILKRYRIEVGLFRPITLWPFPYHQLVKASLGKRAVFVFELSSGQMWEDVKLALGESVPVHFYGRMGGGVFREEELVNFVKRKIKV
jgi:2-oxoglutarate ferredoxin oxidoreductase subunit alpha